MGLVLDVLLGAIVSGANNKQKARGNKALEERYAMILQECQESLNRIQGG